MRSSYLATAATLLCLAYALHIGGIPSEAWAQDAADKKVTLRMGGIVSTEDLLSKAMNMIAQEAAAKSKGTITIRVFPAGQLGNATSQIEAVGLGVQDMFVDASAWMNQYVPDKLLANMFFMISKESDYQKFLQGDMNRRFDAEFLKKTNIRIIANNYIRAARQFVTKRPINSDSDFVGKKVRVPDSKAFLESVSALGMKATQIPLGETYLALTQGLVDSAELSLDMLYSMKWHEATRNVVITNHLYDSNVVMIHNKTFEALSASQQKVLGDVCREVGEWYSKEVRGNIGSIIEKMKNEKTNVITGIDTAPMRAKVMNASVRLESQGLWSKGLLEELKAMLR